MKNYHNFLDRVFGRQIKKLRGSDTQTYLECLYQQTDIQIEPNELDFSSISHGGSSGSHSPGGVYGSGNSRTVIVRNNSSHKVIACWMQTGETRTPSQLTKFQVADSLHSTFSVTPNNVEIPPRGEYEFTVIYRPQKELAFDGETLECFVYLKRNRVFRLVDAKKFTPPWCLNLRCQGHSMGHYRDDCRVEISDTAEPIRMRSVAVMQRSFHVFLIRNKGDTRMVYKILNAQDEGAPSKKAYNHSMDSLDAEKDSLSTPFNCYPRRGCIYPHSFHCIVVEFAPTKANNAKNYAAKIPIVINYEDSVSTSAVPGGYRYLRVVSRCWQPQMTVQQVVNFPTTCEGIKSSVNLLVQNLTEIPLLYETKVPARFRGVFAIDNGDERRGNNK